MADSPTPPRRPLISGNWKMNLNHLEAIQVVQKLSYRLSSAETDAVEVSMHPPFTSLRTVQTIIGSDDLPLALGAQDCHWEDAGAFTGEVSAPMLAKLDVAYVIVGHSERRQLLGETDEMVRAKLGAVLRHSMTPILCVGETLEERDAGTTLDKVASQLRSALDGVSPEAVRAMVVAYEPIWAIGTGRNATPEDAQEVAAAIRAGVGKAAGQEAANFVRIQYGGSVKGSNAAPLLAQPDIDGALVGGASLDPDDFAAIVAAQAAC